MSRTAGNRAKPLTKARSLFDRLRLLETNYGRECGWIVEYQGQPLVELVDCRYEDQFWESYAIEVVTNDPALRQLVFTKEFWDRAEVLGLIWRNREFNEVAPLAFPAIGAFPEPGRLLMRALYLPGPHPSMIESFLLFLRRTSNRLMCVKAA